MAGMSEVAMLFSAVLEMPEMPLVESAAIWVVVMLTPSALTWPEVKAPSAAVERLAKFAVLTALMAVRAVLVRPEAWEVPIRPSWPPLKLAATTDTWLVVRALTWAEVRNCAWVEDRPLT